MTDLNEAFTLGEKAVSLAEEGITASMVTLQRTSNAPYQVVYEHAEIRHIANEAKCVPREWINEEAGHRESPIVLLLSFSLVVAAFLQQEI